jgi:DNA polymerase-1
MLVRKCYAKLDFLENEEGRKTGMEFGFLRTLEKLQGLHTKAQIVMCWDSPKNLRKEKCPEYKANRTPMPDGFWARVKEFRETLLNHLYPYAALDGYEADDVIATLALLNASEKQHVYIFADDADFMQLVSPCITQIKSFQSQLYYWDIPKVRERYGVNPIEMPLFRAFIGDKSDNLQGVKRLHRAILAVRIIETRGITNVKERVLKMLSDEGSWSAAMFENLLEFVKSGKFMMNYQLMKLKPVKGVELVPSDGDAKAVTKWLTMMNIKSLRMCAKYLGKIEKEGEEF